ncbi:HAMP domain-containing histidine kinase [Mucilaginibacter sp. RS28]|uniref:histidine kinase n=1 Tax=Mucilaginibacter straminoryzae TaxID=2932774 RepID=A0A9X1X4U6_9SPHI|nr:HAMP domain-containing sensor histidine kinase [Mucilaginibacter straminoryzae]MCJ8211059.1 HAMP domain-containing histidine kinase [Mucilaginibacter straminoryzae]
MKLTQLYNRASIIITLSILLVAGIVYYIAIGYISNKQLDKDLTEEMEELSAYINHKQQLPKPIDFDEDQASFTSIGQQKIKRRFVDTPFIEPGTSKAEAGRAVVDMVSLRGVNYKVVIAESKETTENLVQLISIITAVLGVLLIVALIITNRFLLAGLWRPFYLLLGQIRAFQVAGNNTIDTVGNIRADEFKELETAIRTMANKAADDYQSLKMFTENASHEMMTPIAVITSKLDNLIQDESLNEAQFEQLQDLYTATGKITKLNQALLLLVKIDNHLISDVAEIELKTTIKQKCRQFAEIIQAKGIQLHAELQEKKFKFSPYLLEILLDNLFSNAVRHNLPGGEIQVLLTETNLVFSNTGKPEPLDSEKVFERFQKGKASEGTGLGLTIARNICNNYGLQLHYHYAAPFHQFIITF